MTRGKMHGFTLVEMLLALAILAALSIAGVGLAAWRRGRWVFR